VPNDASVIDWYRDKRAVAAAAGAGFVSALGTGPYLVKPRFGTGSVGISVSTDRFEAEAVAQEQNGTLERYEQGPLYSAEVYVRGGRVLHLGVTNRIVSDEPYFVERVKSFPHEPNTQWEHDVERWVDELVGRLRPWRGFLHIEFIETRAGFRLIEVNPRLGGALVGPAIAACTNVDPYGVMVFDALGRPAELPVTALRMGGYSHVSLYAEASGVLAEISGVDRLGSFPGEISWCPSKSAGATLPSGLDYRSRIGNLAAYGPSAPIAQDRVLAAARALTFRVAPAG
jgi:biotin carboxylase